MLVALLANGWALFEFSRAEAVRVLNVTMANLVGTQEARLREAHASLIEKAQLVASRTALRRNLARYMETPDPALLAQVADILDDAMDGSSRLLGAGVVDTDGTVLVPPSGHPAWHMTRQVPGFDFADHQSVRILRQVDSVAGQPAQVVSLPLLWEKRFVGVIFVWVSLDKYRNIVELPTALGRQGSTLVAFHQDADEAFLLAPATAREQAGRWITLLREVDADAAPILQALANHQAWHPEATNLAGRKVYAYTKYLDDLHIALAMEFPHESLAGWLLRIEWVYLVIQGVTIVVTLLVLWLLLSTMINPMRDLVRFAYFVQHGRAPKSVRTREWVRNEIIVLEEAINDMANRLLEDRSNLQKEVHKQLKNVIRERDRAMALARSKSDFLANMSHEIRTPMNGILGMLEMVSLNELSEDQAQRVASIRRSAIALLQILNDILDFSKIDSGKVEILAHPTSLHRLLEDAVELFLPRAAEQGIELRLHLDPKLEKRHICDEKHMRQIVFNLLGNAVKFTRQGHVTLSATVSAEPAGKQEVCFAVEDTGIGISEENIASIFDAYTQVESDAARSYQGTGLGLAISQRLAELMHTKIEVDSRVGEGSRFELRSCLPVAERYSEKERLEDVRVGLAMRGSDLRERVLAHLSAWGADDVALLPVPDAEPEPGAGQADAGEWAAFDLLFCEEVVPPGEPRAERKPAPGRPTIFLTREPALSGYTIKGCCAWFPAEPLKPSRLHELVMSLLGRGPALPAGRSVPKAGSRPLPSREEAIAAGELILIVEDNPTNVEVLREQLETLGLRCEAAVDGVAGLAEWQTGQYAAIITDCHMPRMDGYEMTRQIRDAEARDEAGPRIPIVAMTANALPGEKENCLLAGMDDMLVKPSSVAEIGRALAPWFALNPDREDAGPAAAPAEEPAAPAARQGDGGDGGDEAAVDLSNLQRTFARKPERIAGMLQKYRNGLGGDLQDLAKAHGEQDGEALKLTAHRMKGAARIIGARDLAAAAEALEEQALDGDGEKRRMLYDTLVSEADRASRFIRDLQFSDSGEVAHAGDAD